MPPLSAKFMNLLWSFTEMRLGEGGGKFVEGYCELVDYIYFFTKCKFYE